MSLVSLGGRGPILPSYFPAPQAAPAFTTTLLIDATGEMVGMVGRVVWFGQSQVGTKNLSRVQFRFGAVTKAGGSALTVSHQGIDLTTGPPLVPNGTVGGSVAIANADASFASNTWYQTGTFSASRIVSYGDRIAIVVEYDGSGRLGADSVVINGWNLPSNSVGLSETQALLKTGGTWATSTNPNLILEFDDGTFGILEGSVGIKTVNTLAYNSGSAADEIALQFQVVMPCTVDGIYAMVLQAGATSDFDIVLYDGTTALTSASVDGNAVVSNGAKVHFLPIAPQTLLANHTYYVAVKPTTTNNVTIYSFDVNDANHWTQDAGTAFVYTTRVDAGSWAAATTTRRMIAGFRISQLDDGNTTTNIGIGISEPLVAG